MKKNKKILYIIALIPLLIIIGLFIWLLSNIFEGEKPNLALDPLPEFISSKQEFSIRASDTKRGLKSLKVSYRQGDRETVIFEDKFPFEGFLNEQGIREYQRTFEFDPVKSGLAQGLVTLTVQVWDHSRRGGGDGNMSLVQHQMTVDTIPPAIRAVTRMHNINTGGTCLVVYRTNTDTIESGIYVDDHFSPGYPVDRESGDGTHVVYFGLPFNAGQDSNIYLWARDRANNTTRATFYYHIREKRFGSENLNISDSFLQRVLPYFYDFELDPNLSDVEKYVVINNESRKTNNQIIYDLIKKSDPSKLWDGTWIRMKNAATTAKFADHRSYYYQGTKIDEQHHMGVDLASLANSPVTAANRGRVVFAQKNGIYGLTVIIDHGQGISSLYGHLSEINAAIGDMVEKDGVIGISGQTGLAGGDHLHFSILVNGIFVNPVEWWDSHWIRDNITRKLDQISGNEAQ